MNPTHPLLQFQVSRQDGIRVCRVLGAAPMETCAEFHQRLSECLEDQPVRVVVDLSELEFMCSLALGSLVTAALRMKRYGGCMGVVAGQGKIREMIELARADALLQVVDTLAAALPDTG